jgi:hypothetical protein
MRAIQYLRVSAMARLDSLDTKHQSAAFSSSLCVDAGLSQADESPTRAR